MSENSASLLHHFISADRIQELDEWIAKYPFDQKQSAVMQALMIVQETHGYLKPEAMDAVAEYLNMPPIAVYEVASFYTMYELKPVGRNTIHVCTNISCMLRGSDKVVNHLQSTLGVQMGETTKDGRFTLKAAECLAACVKAPMMQINKDYHENLTDESINAALEQYP